MTGTAGTSGTTGTAGTTGDRNLLSLVIDPDFPQH